MEQRTHYLRSIVDDNDTFTSDQALQSLSLLAPVERLVRLCRDFNIPMDGFAAGIERFSTDESSDVMKSIMAFALVWQTIIYEDHTFIDQPFAICVNETKLEILKLDFGDDFLLFENFTLRELALLIAEMLEGHYDGDEPVSFISGFEKYPLQLKITLTAFLLRWQISE